MRAVLGRAVTAPVPSLALARAHDAGRVAHPGIPLDRDAFAKHAEGCAERRRSRRGGGPSPGVVEVPEGLAGDVYLAAACLGRVPGAWERLQATHAGRLVALGRSRGASVVEAEQQVADLLADVAVAPSGSGRPPPLAQYDGSGSLFGWLATCLLRRLAARARAAEPLRPLPPTAAARPGGDDDPAQAALRRELEERLRGALRRAIDALTVQERSALVLLHRDGWSGTEVARLLGIGPPRVSRLRTQATEKVRRALLPLLRSEGRPGRGVDAWDALRDAVGATLAPVAIPARGARPRDEDPSSRRPLHG